MDSLDEVKEAGHQTFKDFLACGETATILSAEIKEDKHKFGGSRPESNANIIREIKRFDEFITKN